MEKNQINKILLTDESQYFDFIKTIENTLGIKANLKMMPFQQGDVYKTYADVNKLSNLCGYTPKVSLEDGIFQFVKWYKDFYNA